MITLFLFLSLLILLIRIFSSRLIIPAVGVFLPVSSLWMGFHMLTQNESCLDNIACVAPPFGQFSTLIGWFLIAESILTACAGVYFLRKNKKRWSRHDTVMFLFASGLCNSPFAEQAVLLLYYFNGYLMLMQITEKELGINQVQ